MFSDGVDLFASEGIEFVTNTDVGRDYPTKQLVDDFDAVVLCGGASKPRDLPIEGRNLKGIHFAMDFLKSNTKSLLDSRHEDRQYISAEGKDVIVIGGGDTGTDCIATALRQSCRSLVQFEILPQPGSSRGSHNPWPQWPRIHRMDYGQQEAEAIAGLDPRCFSIKSESFIGNDIGEITGIRTNDIIADDVIGRGRQTHRASQTPRTWSAHLVLIAMGFVGPLTDGPIADLNLSLTERGTLKVDQNKMTKHRGVFAAGDIERGQSLIVWAIADGRHTAKQVHEYLTNCDALSSC